MKKTIVLMLALLLAVGGMAQEKKAKKEKTYNEKAKSSRKVGTSVPYPWWAMMPT